MSFDLKTELPQTSTNPDAAALAAAIDDMAATLTSDFGGGMVGRKHNTYQHRSRVIRQLTQQLSAMRAPAPKVTA